MVCAKITEAFASNRYGRERLSLPFSLRRHPDFLGCEHERPVFPPLSNPENYALSAIFVLRARAARKSNLQIGFRPVIGSALMHDRFRKTNGNKPFVQCSNVDLFRDTQRVFKFDT